MTRFAIPEGLEPLGVWELKGEWPPGWGHGDCQQATWWLIDHLPFEALDTIKVEFYVLDGPFAVAYPADAGPPCVVALGELPPAHLLG